MSGDREDQAAESSAVAIGHAMLGVGGGSGQMGADLETLTAFQKRVDDLLHDLDGSAADSMKMSDDRIPASAFGAGFSEASNLHKVYQEVHDQLTTLSRLLSEQIGALSTTVHGAKHGYSGVDEDAQRQMWQVQQRLQHHYEPKLDPYKEHKHESGHGGGGDGSQGGGSGGDGGTSY